MQLIDSKIGFIVKNDGCSLEDFDIAMRSNGIHVRARYSNDRRHLVAVGHVVVQGEGSEVIKNVHDCIKASGKAHGLVNLLLIFTKDGERYESRVIIDHPNGDFYSIGSTSASSLIKNYTAKIQPHQE